MPLSIEQRLQSLELMAKTIDVLDDLEKAGDPVTASGANRGDPNAGLSMAERMATVRGQLKPTTPASGTTTTVTLTAAAGARGIPAGTTITDSDQVATIMSETLNQMRPQESGGRVERTCVSGAWEYPEDRRLTGDSMANRKRIESVCGLTAKRWDPVTASLTASGGICLPVNVDYAVPTWSTADRPAA